VVVCTITALVIIITGSIVPSGDVEGVALTSRAFASVFDWFPVVLLVAVLLFAFSTVISWSYYGLKAFTYLLGEGRDRELAFKGSVLVATVLGSSINLFSVMNFADAMVLAMALPNLVGVYLLAPVVKREFTAYWRDYKAGRLQTYR